MNATILGASLTENDSVKAILQILDANGKTEEANALRSTVSGYDKLESLVSNLKDEISDVRDKLSKVQDERNHPLRTALQKLLNGLEKRLNAIIAALGRIKETIVEGCKSAATAFKEGGITALANFSDFFQVKPKLAELEGSIADFVSYHDSRIQKIDALATTYHQAGRAFGNAGRIMRGEEPLEAIKPNGKLAVLISASPRIAKRFRNNQLKLVKALTAAVERLGEQREGISVLKAIAQKLPEPANAPDKQKTKSREESL
jgi:uncharacterized phage infection (PIP) family protein YhgE